MKKLFIIPVLLLFLLSGCATYQAISTAPLMEASLKISVGRVLHNNPDWVEPTYNFTSIALTTLKTQEITNLGVIDDLFVQAMQKDLLPEEQDLALVIFTSIKHEVLRDLKRRGVTNPEGRKVYIIEALTWVNNSAAIRK